MSGDIKATPDVVAAEIRRVMVAEGHPYLTQYAARLSAYLFGQANPKTAHLWEFFAETIEPGAEEQPGPWANDLVGPIYRALSELDWSKPAAEPDLPPVLRWSTMPTPGQTRFEMDRPDQTMTVVFHRDHPACGAEVTVYWHVDPDGDDRLMVEVAEGGEVSVPVRVRHNDGLAYDSHGYTDPEVTTPSLEERVAALEAIAHEHTGLLLSHPHGDHFDHPEL